MNQYVLRVLYYVHIILFNFPLTFLYNTNMQKCIKFIGIYQIFIIQFTILMGEEQEGMATKTGQTEKASGEAIAAKVSNLLTKVNEKLCPFCEFILRSYSNYCSTYKLGIVIPLIILIVLILFFQYICINFCRSSNSRKKKKKEGLRMNSYDPRYERSHGQMYQGQVYGQYMQQPHMFPGEGICPNKHRQQFLYEQVEGPRKKKRKMKQSKDNGPNMKENNDENKTRSKKKKKKKKKKTDGQSKRKNSNQNAHYFYLIHFFCFSCLFNKFFIYKNSKNNKIIRINIISLLFNINTHLRCNMSFIKLMPFYIIKLNILCFIFYKNYFKINLAFIFSYWCLKKIKENIHIFIHNVYKYRRYIIVIY
ncbi:hypothetical protein PGO_094460 [Plasmodium gonderi]|uniref:Variable surface protein n=1 Tax=Plasmodium gonderi TaxID=77519 RepID=A0A1Y1JIQ6_PLAGO|nr:hypothetical protein PGO_094460 [Plasmodium gonderi]GAW81245.1 hypothetical protein PGO_094460 [Plasmodium gonderi]